MKVESLYWKSVLVGNRIFKMIRKQKKNSSKRIYVEPRGGLCNRLRVIASAYKLSYKYDAHLIVFWKITPNLNSRYDRLFCQRDDIEIIESSYKMEMKFWKRAILCDACFIDCTCEEKEKIEQTIANNNDIYITSIYNFYEIIDFSIFKPVDAIQKKINNNANKINENTIGIHIRRTDNEKSILYSPLSMFKQYINASIKANKRICFYLATDSEAVENDLNFWVGGVYCCKSGQDIWP